MLVQVSAAVRTYAQGATIFEDIFSALCNLSIVNGKMVKRCVLHEYCAVSWK
jgi:hypothetical protein